MINVGFYGNSIYMNPAYPSVPVTRVPGVDAVTGGTGSTGQVHEKTRAEKQAECQTCKHRKYVDGSNEGDVSFKAPGHIDPGASQGVVMSHELEHVANARQEGSKPGKQLVSATVSLQYAVCPECGRVYVAGGETTTTIKTSYNESNPYDRGRKTIEGSILAGMNVDAVA